MGDVVMTLSSRAGWKLAESAIASSRPWKPALAEPGRRKEGMRSRVGFGGWILWSLLRSESANDSASCEPCVQLSNQRNVWLEARGVASARGQCRV